MPDPSGPLPADVLEAVERGHTLEAIKRLRAATGLGLKEAKDAIDAHLRGDPVSVDLPASTGPLPPLVIESLRRGDKIGAIKLLRHATGLDLKEAKDAVDAAERFFERGRSS
jgi:ribosomal protein L7/L12